jgi:hypothetical protein
MLEPLPHHSSSLAPGVGFIGRLHGDVGGGSSSSGTSGGSSSFSDTSGGGFIIRQHPLRLLGLQRRMPPRQRGELV